MSNGEEKQYCLIDHANKQGDRERRKPAGRASNRKKRIERREAAVRDPGRGEHSQDDA